MRTVGACIVAELVLIGLESLPGDMARMRLGRQHRPFLACQASVLATAVGTAPLAGVTKGEGRCVSAVVQHLKHSSQPQCLPMQFALVRSAAQATGMLFGVEH